MKGKNIIYLILGIILIIVLGPSIFTIFGTIISGIFTIIAFVILVAVLGLVYLKYKAKKEINKSSGNYSKYNYSNKEDLGTEENDDDDSVIIDVDYKEVDNDK